MSTYVKAVLKVANNEYMIGANKDIKDMVIKCLSAGFQSFTWKGRIFVILKADKDADEFDDLVDESHAEAAEAERLVAKLVKFGEKMYTWIRTPFDLKDFEV